MKSYFIPALAMTLCSFSNAAGAGDKKGFLFGKDPVIFESSISYGWLADTTGQGLIENNAVSLLAAGQIGVTFSAAVDVPGLVNITQNTVTVPIESIQLSVIVDNPDVFSHGYAHSKELNFGIRTQTSDNVEAFVRFNYARLETTTSPESFNFTATAITAHEGSNGILGPGIFGPVVAPGQLIQNFTGAGTVNVGFSDTDIYSFQMGMKRNFFKPVNISSIKAQPFIDVAFGFAVNESVSIVVSGKLPNLSDVLEDIDGVGLPFDTPGVTTQLPTVAVGTVQTTQSTEIAKFTMKPVIILGAGIDFSLTERTALSVDLRYKRNKIHTINKDPSLDTSRFTIGLRLSQTF